MLRHVAKKYLGATVMLVRLNRQAGRVDGIGSAFLCHDSGYLLTCAHTFRLTDELGVVEPEIRADGFMPMQTSSASVAEVKVAQYDAEHDVALLKLSGSNYIPPFSQIFMAEEEVEIGASVAYIGVPFPKEGQHARHVGQSIISSKVLSSNGTRQFQLNALIHEGCSGGPVVDVQEERILGIVAGRFSPVATSPIKMNINGKTIGSESTVGYAISITYGLDLLRAEGLNV